MIAARRAQRVSLGPDSDAPPWAGADDRWIDLSE